MYLDYWSLESSPFEAVPDSRFFFHAPQYDDGLAALNYAVRDAGEPALITGPVGCGKTLLLRAVRRQLSPDDYHVVFVPELADSTVGLLRRVAYSMSREVPADTAAALDAITRCIDDAEQCGRPVVVMLDDWPVTATPELFEELRWLLNPDTETTGVNALFACEPFDALSKWPDWLAQRLFSTVTLTPLTPTDVPEYLAHRLRGAGHADGTVFTRGAAAVIAEWAGGVPRVVHRVAHLALHIAALQLRQQVDEQTVRQAFTRLVKPTMTGTHCPRAPEVVM
ncbi:MAG: AAA family ATPase [Phycisphaerae bacterium]|nr:AAA family ATPase [Phycisphaerae bacterium]